MTGTFVWNAATPRALLNAAIEGTQQVGSPHVVPLFEAVRDAGISYLQVLQGGGPRRLPPAPWIIHIGDDPRPPKPALGPNGFAADRLYRMLDAACCAIVVAGPPWPYLYIGAADIAAKARATVLLIDTRPEHEIAWLALLQERLRGPIHSSSIAASRA